MAIVHGGNLHHIYADTEILSARYSQTFIFSLFCEKKEWNTLNKKKKHNNTMIWSGADLTGADLTWGRFGLGPIWPATPR